MRVVALNINHRTRHITVPDGLLVRLLDLRPDILFFLEFVEATRRERFRAQLHRAGLEHCEASSRMEYAPGRYTNQVFVASRKPIRLLRPSQDSPDVHVQSNTIVVDHPWGTILAARRPLIPTNKVQDERNSWDWVCSLQGDLFIGDVNFDPFRSDRKSKQFAGIAQAHGWAFKEVHGEWSYCGHTGKRTCIDHAATRSPTTILRAEYVAKGIAPEHTDHAALVIDLPDRC